MTFRIRYKIALLFTGVIAALMGFAYWQVDRITRGNYESYAAQEINRYGNVVDGYLADLMRRNLQSIHAFANIAELNDALRTTNLVESDAIFRIPYILGKYRRGYDFDAIRLYDPSGDILGDAGWIDRGAETVDFPRFSGSNGFSGVLTSPGGLEFAASAPTPTGACVIVGRTILDDRLARMIRDTTGVHVLLFSGSNLLGSSLSSAERSGFPVRSSFLAEAEKGKRLTVSVAERGLTLLYTPFRDPEHAVAGAMVLAVSSEVVTRIASETRRAIAVIVIAGAIVSLLLGFLFSAQLTRPLNRLMDWARRISAGDLDYRASIRSRDETRELGHVFEAMTENLKESFRTIRAQNESLAAANEQLQELDRLKTDFLATISHELKTPLTSILGFAQISKKKLETLLTLLPVDADPKLPRTVRQQEDNLDIILDESKRLAGLIGNVMDLSQIEAGRVVWKIESVSVREALEAALMKHAAVAEAKNLRIDRDFPEAEFTVRGDRDRFIQVLDNLLSNAVRFTEAGFIACRIETDGKTVRVTIADTGTGIPPEELPRIFDKFRQVGDVLTAKPQGLGLGLAVCKGIVEGLGGKIAAESRVDEGSRFTVELPAGE